MLHRYYSDGDACNGDEVCDGTGTCQPGVTLDCDDGDFCTQDSCDSADGCENQVGPAVSCLEGWAKGSLLVKENSWSCEGGSSRSRRRAAYAQGALLGVPLRSWRIASWVLDERMATSLSSAAVV